MSTELTQQELTMGTVICSWNGLMCTTMKPLVSLRLQCIKTKCFKGLVHPKTVMTHPHVVPSWFKGTLAMQSQIFFCKTVTSRAAVVYLHCRK